MSTTPISIEDKTVLVVLTFREHQIDELNAFHDPDPARFGLPAMPETL